MNALIIGVGNIGIRHLQGISKTTAKKKNIYLFDISKKYKTKYKPELQILKKKINIFFVKKLYEIKKIKFDIIIISTTAENRTKILISILDNIKSKYIVIEKPICNSIKDLKNLKKISSNKIFVNFPHRYCLWNEKINNKIQKYFSSTKLDVLVTGSNLNIASNVAHYVDLLNMWTKSLPKKIDTSGLGNWKKSKRKGFYELSGSIKIFFKNGHFLKIHNNEKYSNQLIYIRNREKKKLCIINYLEGYAKFVKYGSVLGKMKFQSDSTNILYKILNSSKIKKLSNLKLSVKCYDKVLNSLVKHSKIKKLKDLDQIMIT